MERSSLAGGSSPYAWVYVSIAEVELYAWVGMYIGGCSVMRERSSARVRLLYYNEYRDTYKMRILLPDELARVSRRFGQALNFENDFWSKCRRGL
jgi:hypothetical protein